MKKFSFRSLKTSTRVWLSLGLAGVAVLGVSMMMRPDPPPAPYPLPNAPEAAADVPSEVPVTAMEAVIPQGASPGEWIRDTLQRQQAMESQAAELTCRFRRIAPVLDEQLAESTESERNAMTALGETASAYGARLIFLNEDLRLARQKNALTVEEVDLIVRGMDDAEQARRSLLRALGNTEELLDRYERAAGFAPGGCKGRRLDPGRRG